MSVETEERLVAFDEFLYGGASDGDWHRTATNHDRFEVVVELRGGV